MKGLEVANLHARVYGTIRGSLLEEARGQLLRYLRGLSLVEIDDSAEGEIYFICSTYQSSRIEKFVHRISKKLEV